MYCPRCGNVNADGASRCSACSSRLDPEIFRGHRAVPRIPTYLFASVLSALFCFMPAGIVSVIFAVQSNSHLEAGDYLGAQSKAKQAYVWAWIAFGLGLVLGLLGLLAQVV